MKINLFSFALKFERKDKESFLKWTSFA